MATVTINGGEDLPGASPQPWPDKPKDFPDSLLKESPEDRYGKERNKAPGIEPKEITKLGTSKEPEDEVIVTVRITVKRPAFAILGPHVSAGKRELRDGLFKSLNIGYDPVTGVMFVGATLKTGGAGEQIATTYRLKTYLDNCAAVIQEALKMDPPDGRENGPDCTN